MRIEWDLDELMLKFYEIEGRFPAYREEVPPAAID